MPAYHDFFGWVVFLFKTYGDLFLGGACVTMLIAITGTIIGFMIGLGVACFQTIPLEQFKAGPVKALLRVVKWILTAYVEVFRGTPMMAQAVLIYYGLSQYLGLDMAPIPAGIFIISINTGAYMTEIVRGGIISIDTGQYEGAQSIGMTHWQTMLKVVLPQAVRNIMPSLGNEFVINIKDSSVLNVIQVTELFFQSKSASGTYFRMFESMVIACAIYFVLTFTTTRLLRYIEKKMDGPDTFTIHGSQGLRAKHVPELKKQRGRLG